MWAISASASRSCQLSIAAREAAYSFCVFARPFFVFVTGIITARGLLLRTSARGALVVATSSARRTNSGLLLISMGVRCLRITRELYHKTAWLLVGISEADFTYRTFCDVCREAL